MLVNRVLEREFFYVPWFIRFASLGNENLEL